MVTIGYILLTGLLPPYRDAIEMRNGIALMQWLHYSYNKDGVAHAGGNCLYTNNWIGAYQWYIATSMQFIWKLIILV